MNETERINTFSIDDAIAQASKLFTSLFFTINIFSKKKKLGFKEALSPSIAC
ncbi:hypothetical protein HanRHA438_Chr08g0368581 [Helianthus annuus]|uniref:Uncharacterized protein n=1 Tax=Helianthus annuus TaxID=4232 RepID=A0A251U8I9_HELAN|nr:hypothetical protein HanXRQr2_Chr08g0356471 [Helianthus annuus]KAJ0540097.1 hypothetical protein HanHA300_Chr08g0294371 [Helianthus annuus]KAJ0548519.1 hypothetical protein HanIR_Chr08g0384741 [Helianthus annuus]KAJ0554839.1 hypothetical protein HanHA89_Chr08g0312871 [Helianthus annuus]KAJ0720404.1 hypothetical protein HanLR1_Chr08g0293191 [Helianthus annuus]